MTKQNRQKSNAKNKIKLKPDDEHVFLAVSNMILDIAMLGAVDRTVVSTKCYQCVHWSSLKVLYCPVVL